MLRFHSILIALCLVTVGCNGPSVRMEEDAGTRDTPPTDTMVSTSDAGADAPRTEDAPITVADGVHALHVASDGSIQSVTVPLGGGSGLRHTWSTRMPMGGARWAGHGDRERDAFLLLTLAGGELGTIGRDGYSRVRPSFSTPRATTVYGARVSHSGATIAVAEGFGDGETVVTLSRATGTVLSVVGFPGTRLFARGTQLVDVDDTGVALFTERDLSLPLGPEVVFRPGDGEEIVLFQAETEHYLDADGVRYIENGELVLITEYAPDGTFVTLHIVDVSTAMELDMIELPYVYGQFRLFTASATDIYYFEDDARTRLRHHSLGTDLDELLVTLEVTPEGDVGPTGMVL